MADTIFETLQEGSFDGIVIPVQTVKLTTGNARAFHTYPYRPGADIEFTGREPVQGVITAVYINGLDGVGASNDLWPGALQLLRDRVQEQKSGPLVIPTLGLLKFASIELDEDYSPEFVDGARVTIRFVEDSSDQFAGLAVKSATAKLPSSAKSADDALNAKAIKAIIATTDDNGKPIVSFSQWVNGIIGQVDQAQLALAAPAFQLAQVVSTLDTVLDEVNYLLSPEDWPIADALRQLKSDTQAAIAEITRSQNFRTYEVPVTSTIPAIAAATRNAVAEILSLNYFDDASSIPAGTTVTVFAR